MHPDKIKELQHELRHEDDAIKRQAAMPKMVGMYFYNIPEGQEEKAASLDIKQLKSGKWAMKKYDKSGRSFSFRKNIADETFGQGKWYPIESSSTPSEPKKSNVLGMYFYNVPENKHDEAKKLNITQLKSGKWAMVKHDTSDQTFEFRKTVADETFGNGKWWTPPTNEDATMTQQKPQVGNQQQSMQQGTIASISGDKATIVTKSGDTQTTTTTPVSSLTRNPDGTLKLNPNATNAQQKIAPGTKVSIENTENNADNNALRDIMKLAGMK